MSDLERMRRVQADTPVRDPKVSTTRPSEGIGARVAKYRRWAGLSARELAEQAGCGLTRAVVANIETGRKLDVTVDQLLAISRVLAVSPAALAVSRDSESAGDYRLCPHGYHHPPGVHSCDGCWDAVNAQTEPPAEDVREALVDALDDAECWEYNGVHTVFRPLLGADVILARFAVAPKKGQD